MKKPIYWWNMPDQTDDTFANRLRLKAFCDRCGTVCPHIEHDDDAMMKTLKGIYDPKKHKLAFQDSPFASRLHGVKQDEPPEYSRIYFEQDEFREKWELATQRFGQLGVALLDAEMFTRPSTGVRDVRRWVASYDAISEMVQPGPAVDPPIVWYNAGRSKHVPDERDGFLLDYYSPHLDTPWDIVGNVGGAEQVWGQARALAGHEESYPDVMPYVSLGCGRIAEGWQWRVDYPLDLDHQLGEELARRNWIKGVVLYPSPFDQRLDPETKWKRFDAFAKGFGR